MVQLVRLARVVVGWLEVLGAQRLATLSAVFLALWCFVLCSHLCTRPCMVALAIMALADGHKSSIP
jgi:hypothetical protein